MTNPKNAAPERIMPLIERGAVLENPDGMLALVTKIDGGMMFYVTESGQQGKTPTDASWLSESTNIYHPQKDCEPTQTKPTRMSTPPVSATAEEAYDDLAKEIAQTIANRNHTGCVVNIDDIIAILAKHRHPGPDSNSTADMTIMWDAANLAYNQLIKEKNPHLGVVSAVGDVLTRFKKYANAQLPQQHRQPVATSRTAEDVENLIVNIAELSRSMARKPAEDFCEAIEPIIQAYGDAAQLEGARKMQSAAADKCSYVRDNNHQEYNAGAAACFQDIRALKPEDVIKA